MPAVKRASARSPFERLGGFVYRRRKAVALTWLLLLALALPFAPQAPGALQAGGFDVPTLESVSYTHLTLPTILRV